MKKLILAIILICLTPIFGFGQITIGPKFGVNMATQFKSDFSVPKYGIAFGGAIDIPISSGFSVQGEFLVTQKGYREEYIKARRFLMNLLPPILRYPLWLNIRLVELIGDTFFKVEYIGRIGHRVVFNPVPMVQTQ